MNVNNILTEDEIEYLAEHTLWETIKIADNTLCDMNVIYDEFKAFARAIEQALKEKNHG